MVDAISPYLLNTLKILTVQVKLAPVSCGGLQSEEF
jgi:hypothetical protein